MALTLIVVSSVFPSLVSVGLTILSHNLVFASTYRLKSRLRLGLAFLVVNSMILISVIRWKKAKISLVSLGEDPVYIQALGINGDESFRFETIISCVYLRVFFIYIQNIRFSRKVDLQKSQVILL